jgi:integrase
MPGLFKPTYKHKQSGQVRKTAKWYGWLTTPDGRKVRKPLATDKSVAQALLAQWIKEVEMDHAGLKDPFVDHRRRPLAEHLSAWEGYLFSKARPTSKAQAQVRVTAFRVRSVFDACGFKLLGDVSASRVAEHIAGLRTNAPPSANRKQSRELSLQTLNFYIKACKQFFRFLVKDRRSPDNPLGHLPTYNVKLDRRHDRRALGMEEIAWLLVATRSSSRVCRGLTGEDRYTLYATALGTGLRASELASLTGGSFQLDCRPPFVRLMAGYAKNQTQVDQPLPVDLAASLRDYLARKPSDRRVWEGTWRERSARMFRKDLAAAREAWLEEAGADAEERALREASSFLAYRDAENLVADFHALRHSYITLLARSGVSPKMAQSLARHSDINLTMSRYTHISLHDQAAALAALPPLSFTQTEERHGPHKLSG